MSVTDDYGGVSGPGYHEMGFDVTIVNKGIRDFVVYSAGYHVTDDLDDQNAHFNADHIYWLPAEEGEEETLPKGKERSSSYDTYRLAQPELSLSLLAVSA